MERSALVPAVAVFAGVLVAGASLDVFFLRLEVEGHQRTGTELAQGSALAIEQEFARSLASASALGAMVEVGATDSQLDGVATRMLALNGGTANLQLARDGVISHLWPVRGNERALGLDLFNHALHGGYSRQVLETRRPLLYGPFELIQGGAGFALRVPVFVAGAGGERSWGLASAIVRLQGLLEHTRITRLLEAGYDYEISRELPGGGHPELLASSRTGGTRLEEPATDSIELPGQVWILGVAPRGGWKPSSSPVVFHVGVLLISLLAALLAYRILSLPETLRREVAARTAELEEAHREQRRAEEAQRHSQKLEAIGLLAGGVAHDFNNLLAGILGYADLLATEAKPGSIGEEAAQTISQAALRGAQLTRQLLAFARNGPQQQIDVDLHALVGEVTTLLARTLDKSVRIESHLDAPRHHVRGDPGQLQQVVLNLAVNARDAMPEGGLLTLASAVEDLDEESVTRGLVPGRYLVLSVTDTGVGIPKEHLDRIFEPFFTTKGEGHGTGLGLATVYGIVKGHHGSVRVYSEERVGSRFVVYLPLHDEPGAARAEQIETVPHGTGVVLVVDDEELVRRSAGRMLASLGYEPVLVSGGQEALDWLAARPAAPIAVVLDLVMPDMDGQACFRQLQARHPGLPVVVTSGFARNSGAQRLLDEGARVFVQKPYRTAELARALAAAIGGVKR